MLGNFTYCNPTKLYFGEQSLEGLHKELPKYGDRVVLIYGGGSIKRNGIYDAVRAILDQEGKQGGGDRQSHAKPHPGQTV